MNKEKIDEFLHFIAQIIKENPDIGLDNTNNSDFIYTYLVRLSVPLDVRKQDISNIFDKWIEYFKNKENINVFVDDLWSGFCQFINQKGTSQNQIKIYIPTKLEFIEENAKIIFDYLSKNNIQHISKINKKIRIDNIVVRLHKMNDVVNLLNFLGNNQQIQEGLMETNPFAINYKGINLAYDGNNSYNACISCYILMYMREKKKNNDLDNVSCEDFANFVKKYYQQEFIDKKIFVILELISTLFIKKTIMKIY